MKLSKIHLKKIIREELKAVLESVPEPSPAVGPRYSTLKSSNIEDEEIDPHDPHRQHKYRTEKPDGIPGVSLALTEEEENLHWLDDYETGPSGEGKTHLMNKVWRDQKAKAKWKEIASKRRAEKAKKRQNNEAYEK